MSKQTFLKAAAFVLAHIIIVAPFVPVASIIPAGLGMLSMSSMALTLILAARWRVVDTVMGGPDKSYGAHRWLGFFSLFGALGHWATASSIGSGIAPMLADGAEDVGTIAAMGLVTMTAAAMTRAIPYHLWKASHMLMGPIFVLAAFHTFFVASPLAVGAIPWAMMAVMSVVGLIAWGQTLKRKVDPTRLVTVEKAVPFDGGADVTLRSATTLPAFKAGQFATIAYNQARSEAHPFTIAGGDATSRRFVIRAAGDWTDHFANTVKVGDKLRLGRGVGRFLPQVTAQRTEQLWVAGGVGITPFMAALEKMQPDSGKRVTLVYCIRSRASAGGLADIEAHARRLPQLDLLVVSDDSREGLTPHRLTEVVQRMDRTAQVYLCGPEGLKLMVTAVWSEAGKLGDVEDRVEGLQAGGDDYLVKPFAFSELAARIEVLARRQGSNEEQSSELTAGDIAIDLHKRTCTRQGQDIDLNPKEFLLLEVFLRSKGRVQTRTMLLERVWDMNFDPTTSVVETHISRLRSKIEKPFGDTLLRTIRGAGYVLNRAKGLLQQSAVRLTLGLLGVFAIVTALAGIATYLLVEREMNRMADARLTAQAVLIEEALQNGTRLPPPAFGQQFVVTTNEGTRGSLPFAIPDNKDGTYFYDRRGPEFRYLVRTSRNGDRIIVSEMQSGKTNCSTH